MIGRAHVTSDESIKWLVQLWLEPSHEEPLDQRTRNRRFSSWQCPRLQLNKCLLAIITQSCFCTKSTSFVDMSVCVPEEKKPITTLALRKVGRIKVSMTGQKLWHLLIGAPNSVRVKKTMDRFKSGWVLLKSKHSSHTHNIVFVLRVPIT